MKYCNYCGVELDNDMTHCPLCGLSANAEQVLSHEAQSKQSIDRDKIIRDFDSLTVRQKRKLFWEISGIILISGILVTLIINVVVNKAFTWAKYNLTASLVLFANISLYTLWRNRPILLISGSLLSTSALLILLDMFSTNLGWGTKLGVPILVSFYILLAIVQWLIGISNQWGFNILAILFMAISLFLICIELFISLYFRNKIHLSWSIIAGGSMMTISALMFFFHYRLKKGIELKRFFHI